MADLYDRLFPPDGETKNLAVHLFEAALVKYVKGTFSSSQISTAFAFDSEADTDWTFITNQINSISAQGAKLDYIQDVMATINARAHGFAFMTKAAFATEIGL